MKYCLIFLILFSAAFQARAASELPLPRFVSVRSSEANVRNGPGLRYPIQWVLVRKSMPVEIIAEFENWRKIRDIEGGEGWVHRSMLSGERTAIILEKTRTLYQEADSTSPVMAYAEAGVVAKLLECNSEWCRVEAGHRRGWVLRSSIWGIYGDEKGMK